MGQQAPPGPHRAARGGGPRSLALYVLKGRGSAGLLCQMKLRGAALWHAPPRSAGPKACAGRRSACEAARRHRRTAGSAVRVPHCAAESLAQPPRVPFGSPSCLQKSTEPPQNSPRCRQTAKRPRPPPQSPSEWHDMRIIVVQLTLGCANAVARNRAESATICTRILTL